jgi:exodeoxyribonuclease V beta subunit
MTAPIPEFDLTGPLPTGTTVLEASAGTGKTYTIAALAARYLAEGLVTLDQLMLVTFGRMATNELRLRVRERLVALETRLAAAVAGAPPSVLDPLEALLTRIDIEELRRRHRRISQALADFDSATIATTHEFCLQMLDGLGVLGDQEPQARFVDHLGDLTREVGTDLFLQRYAASGTPPTSYSDALRLADQAVSAGHAVLAPDADPGSDAAERVAYAAAVRAEVERRKRSGRLFTYDDMLTRLLEALADPDRGGQAARRLNGRYRVVMVDEFQDTDPLQWEILERAFHRASTLILIGDPKQAIYAFRGADVFSYLDAVGQADHVATLATNRRSDADLIAAMDELMGGAALGDEQIVVRPVKAAHPDRRLRSGGPSGPSGAPIRVRVTEHAADADRAPGVAAIRPVILDDLVADITARLTPGNDLHLDGTWRQVQPADIAVLVRKNERGEAIRERLVAAGVPAVMHGATSVFTSPMAQEWLTLLVALEQPRQAAVRQAALTSFIGMTLTELARADEDELIQLTQRVRRWSRVLEHRGVAALLETMSVDTRVPERLLATVGGERRLTDVRHLAQSLHGAMTAGQLGISALVEWLRGRMAEALGGLTEGTRRLETDALAVTILTVHRSKGLEFPIVYLPEAWDRHVNSTDEGGVLSFHSTTAEGRSMCLLDVGGLGPGRAERWQRQRAEESGEDLRLLYVALTRAQCQAVTWWAPSVNTPASALHRFLYRDRAAAVVEAQYPLAGDPFGLPARPGTELEVLAPRPLANWQPTAEPIGPLAVRTFNRQLDLDWRRTSYSALTAAVHGLDLSLPSVASEPEPSRVDDESAPVVDAPAAASDDSGPPSTAPGWDQLSPMAGLPQGADFGTAVHSVFELVDAADPDLPTALTRACRTVLARSAAGLMTPEQLATGLAPTFATPLGPLAGGRRLCDIPQSDKLAELSFEFGLAGGEVTTADVRLGLVADLLRRHLGSDDPLAGYPDRLDHPALAGQSLKGYLTGSIDAVLRVHDEHGEPSYLVVDYKTNWLGGYDGAPLTLAAYQPTRLVDAMMQAHYPLQALLYAVAVHRLLRWRQRDYAPERHLGGVLYLFVRGMAGADTPAVDGVPGGVFAWRPPAALVIDLSDLLDGRVP